MATITKRGDSYRFRVSVGYDSENKQIIKSMTWKPPVGMTQKQAEKEAERQAVLFEEKVKAGQCLNGNIRFKDFCERWFEDYAKTQLREKTAHRYKGLKERVYQALGYMRLDRIQPQHLLEFYKNLAEPGVKENGSFVLSIDLNILLQKSNMTITEFCKVSGVSDTTLRGVRKGDPASAKTAQKIADTLGVDVFKIFNPKNEEAGLSSQTIKNYHIFISSVFERAVKWGLIYTNPCRRIDSPRAKKKHIKYLDEEQTVHMLELLQQEKMPYRMIFTLLIYCGMRRGEVMGLEWKDIDFERGILSINRTLQYTKEKGIYTDDVKTTSSRRSMKLSDEVIELLKEYKLWQNEKRMAVGDQWQESDNLFTQWNGLPMSPSTPYKWLQGFTKRHNLPPINIHSLRHTNATLLIRQGVNIRTVAGRLGHLVTSTTLNIYSHELQSADAAAADSLSEVFKRKE